MWKLTAKTRIIGGLLLCALALTGCSAVRVGYNQASTLTWWWLDGYMDFDAEQAPRVKAALEQWFAWHRRTQLPDYADLLAAAQVQVLQPVTPAQMCRWNADLRERIDASLRHAVPLAAQLLPAVGPEQLQHLRKRYAKSNRQFEEDFLQPRPDERLDATVERTIDRAEMLYGRLDAHQRELIARSVAASPFDPAAWYAERQVIQAEVLRTLAQLTAGGPDRADPESKVGGLSALVRRALHPPPGPYRAYQQRLFEYNCALAAKLHNSTTPAQRQAARARFKAWEDDLRALAAQQPGPVDSPARQIGAIAPALQSAWNQPAWSLIATPVAGLAQPSSASKALSPSASATPPAFSVAKG